MYQIKFPVHMVKAYKKAINEFAKDGFLFDLKNEKTDESGNIIVDIIANPSEYVKLGIKIGYLLATN